MKRDRDLIPVCPECGETGPRKRINSGDYRCRYCSALFPEPERREPVKKAGPGPDEMIRRALED